MFSTLSGLWVIFKSIIVKYSLQWRSKTILDSNSDSQARSSLLQCTSFHWSSAFHKLKHSVRQVFWISLHLNILGITTVKLCYIKSSNSPHMYSHIPENFPLGSLDVNLIVFSLSEAFTAKFVLTGQKIRDIDHLKHVLWHCCVWEVRT